MFSGMYCAVAALKRYEGKIEAAAYSMSAGPAVKSDDAASGTNAGTDEVPVRPGSTPSGSPPALDRLHVGSEPDAAAPVGLVDGLTGSMINQRYFEAQVKTIRMFGETMGTIIDLIG